MRRKAKNKSVRKEKKERENKEKEARVGLVGFLGGREASNRIEALTQLRSSTGWTKPWVLSIEKCNTLTGRRRNPGERIDEAKTRTKGRNRFQTQTHQPVHSRFITVGDHQLHSQTVPVAVAWTQSKKKESKRRARARMIPILHQRSLPKREAQNGEQYWHQSKPSPFSV